MARILAEERQELLLGVEHHVHLYKQKRALLLMLIVHMFRLQDGTLVIK